MAELVELFDLRIPPFGGADRFEALEALGCIPMAGDIERAGTFGGGPGSAPGERRCMRCEEPGACIIAQIEGLSSL